MVMCLRKVGTRLEKVVMCLCLKRRKWLSVYMGYVSRESGYVSTQRGYVSRERGSVSPSQRKKVVYLSTVMGYVSRERGHVSLSQKKIVCSGRFLCVECMFLRMYVSFSA